MRHTHPRSQGIQFSRPYMNTGMGVLVQVLTVEYNWCAAPVQLLTTF
jgi:hypothetical protein